MFMVDNMLIKDLIKIYSWDNVDENRVYEVGMTPVDVEYYEEYPMHFTGVLYKVNGIEPSKYLLLVGNSEWNDVEEYNEFIERSVINAMTNPIMRFEYAEIPSDVDFSRLCTAVMPHLEHTYSQVEM